jgi:hypothetical protein
MIPPITAGARARIYRTNRTADVAAREITRARANQRKTETVTMLP